MIYNQDRHFNKAI